MESLTSKRFGMVAASAATLVLLACVCGGATAGLPTPEVVDDQSVDVPAVEATPAVAATATPAPSATPLTGGEVGATTDLAVVNQTSLPLCGLYISEDASNGFFDADNQLLAGEQIAAGTTYTITDIPFGVYDLQVNDCNGNLINALYGSDMSLEQMTWTISEGELTIINDSSFEICELYVAPNSAPEWGPNQLAGTLPTGQQTTFTLAVGSWDLQAIPCDTSVEAIINYATEVGTATTWTLFDQ